MKKYLKHYTSSIRMKLIIAMTCILGLTMVTFCVMNYVFLPHFYQQKKVSLLRDSFTQVNHIVAGDQEYQDQNNASGLAAKSTLSLEKLEEDRATSIYIFQLTNFLGEIFYSFDYPDEDVLTKDQSRIIEDMTREYVPGVTPGQWSEVRAAGKELIQRGGDFSVYKVMDDRIGSNYIELFGQLQSGEFVYLRTNFQSMKENVQIFNRFMIYVACGALIAAMILMILIGNSLTKPILQIADIAKQMAELNFEVRYPVETSDEIGVLGNSINVLSDTLESTISELKAANNELQNDIQDKIQIDEMRKEFLSNVSHELKTPIALIQGYAEGLQDNISDDQESREFYCEVIIDEANKMNKMVKKLLTLNQIEFGKEQVNFERFDIIQVVQSVIQSAALLAEQKGARIILSEDYGSAYVWADEYMVEEVITNYISNAINHVDGEKRIEVTIEQQEDKLRVSVFNTGKPIPESELDKIWIKFYKVDKARTREYGGSGIGLSIVKAIVDTMNQKCGVQNHEDGVEFWFELDIKSNICT
ncbi:MAG: HAMP domain-containing histidine kinase [Ruminococcus flavefaciens]|nr:HAMP domain-containing histidine kinase [Ruminococcus flavefaciens]